MLQVIIDWLEFTVLNEQLPLVLDTMGLSWDDFSALSKGRFGYHNQYKWEYGHVYIMFTALSKDDEITIDTRVNEHSGVHVMITGQGCKQYSAQQNLLKLIQRLYFLGDDVNFSRIDLAIDDYESKIINYDKIHDSALAGHFTSRWSKWDELNSRQTSNNEFLGRTMYFGAQASDLFCRIYDKTLERKANADEEVKTQWTRLELVYRKDRAKRLTDYIIKNEMPIGTALKGTLKQYLRFLKPADDQNKARWPTIDWWDRLLSNVDNLQLTIKKEARTIEDMTTWVDNQIAPTLSAILQAQEGDMNWLRKIVAKGSHRLSQRHMDAIKAYKQSLCT